MDFKADLAPILRGVNQLFLCVHLRLHYGYFYINLKQIILYLNLN